MKRKENIISVVVNNKPDVLARLAGTFSGRGFNIESIAGNITINRELTKMVITTLGDEETVIKLEKQLNKIIDVISVEDLTGDISVQREMILIRVVVNERNKKQLMQTIDTYKWKVVNETADFCILEISGTKNEIEKALALLAPMGIDDFTRTGTIALKRC